MQMIPGCVLVSLENSMDDLLHSYPSTCVSNKVENQDLLLFYILVICHVNNCNFTVSQSFHHNTLLINCCGFNQSRVPYPSGNLETMDRHRSQSCAFRKAVA